MTDNNKNSLKTAFVATLCKHSNTDSYQKDAFKKADIKGLYKKLKDAGEVISKADFLDVDENGENFLASEKAWDNFHYIVDIVRENGDEFTADDFLKLEDNSFYKRPLIESMKSHQKMDKVFNAHVWKGRFEEMENLWYHIPPAKRKEMTGDDSDAVPLDLKREVMGLDTDTVLREDELKNIGIDYRMISSMFDKSGAFDAFLQKLTDNKMKLQIEDILFVGSEGDTIFHNAAAWSSYEKVVDILQQNGEKIGIEELTFKRGRKPSILERAAQHGMLNKVFEPRFWNGRPNEMMQVWDTLLPAQKTLKYKKFDEIVTEVENMSYSSLVSLHAENVTKEALLSPIISNDNNDGEKSNVTPLGLSDTWKHMDVLMEGLEKRDEVIDVETLRMKSGILESSILMIAADSGCFDKVLNIVRNDSDSLQVQDFLDKNKNNTSLLKILIDKKELNKVFSPEVWVGRSKEMKILWSNVPEKDKRQVDFEKVSRAVNQAGIRQMHANRKKRGGFKK